MKQLVLAALLLSGCILTGHSRSGNYYPPKPGSCELTFLYGDMSKLLALTSQGYEQVGSVSAGNGWGGIPEELNDRLKRAVRADACQLGGDVVMMLGGNNYSASFAVLRKPEQRRQVETPTPPPNTLAL